jgi:hypothetical protein
VVPDRLFAFFLSSHSAKFDQSEITREKKQTRKRFTRARGKREDVRGKKERGDTTCRSRFAPALRSLGGMSALSERIRAVEPSTYTNSETAIEAKLVLLGDSGTVPSSLHFPLFASFSPPNYLLWN